MAVSKRTYLATAYVTVLHLVVFALAAKVDAVPKILNEVGMATVVHEGVAHLARRHPGLVLVGDSLTYYLGEAPGAINLARPGETTAGLLQRLPTYPRVEGASVLLLLIGTNDVWAGKTTGLPRRLAELEKALPAGAPLIWSAIPPADDFRIDLADVAEANRVIRALCAARPQCAYVDTWAALADAHARPVLRYFREDRVHLSAEGYSRWLAELAAALDRITSTTNAQ